MSISAVEQRISEIVTLAQNLDASAPAANSSPETAAGNFNSILSGGLAPATPAANSSAVGATSTQASSSVAYQSEIDASASRYNVDPSLVRAVIARESSFDPNAVSPTGAQGLMQLEPATAATYGVNNLTDPAQNIDGGTHYLSDLLKQYNGNLDLALAAYNAGPGNVASYGGVPPFSQSYVDNVKSSYQAFKDAGNGAPR